MNSNQNNDDVAKIENIKKEEEKKRKKENNDNENDIIISGETLSKSRINITFSDMNESNASNATFKTYKSIPFQYDNLDLDIPNFSPTRYKKNNWKMTHSCSCFLFATFYGISTGFINMEGSNTYFTLLGISHAFLTLATLLEWCYFKRGCIGESNLNSKLKQNVDQSLKAKILRSEYGIKYFISFMAAIILLIGDFIHYYSNELNLFPDEVNIILVYFNLFGMMTLALAQILKIDKLLNLDHKISYVKNDFSKSLFEIIFFFASLLEGGTFMIQLFNIHLKESTFYVLHLIFKIFDGLLFFSSAIFLQFNYFFSDYCSF
jgi:hypothetical protein